MSTPENFDLQQFLPYLLNQAADTSSQGFQEYYKSRYGMLRTEWRVMFHLGQFGKMTAKDICDRARVHKTKVSRAVGALEAKRFLSRKQMTKDRRQEMLSLTSAGKRAYDDLRQLAQEYDGNLMVPFNEDEQEVLRRCLIRIAQI